MAGADGGHGGGVDHSGGFDHGVGTVGELAHYEHGAGGHSDAHLVSHGPGHHGGKVIGHNTAVWHIDHHHGGKFSFPNPSNAHPSGGGAAEAALDSQRFDKVISWDEAARTGTEPTHMVLIHATPHDYVDHSAELLKICREVGKGYRNRFIRVDKRLPNVDGFEDMKKTLLPWHGLVENVDPRNMPDVWRPKHDGTTSMVRQWWQIGVWKDGVGMLPDRPVRMLLDITWVVWYNKNLTLYETKMSFRVVPMPVWVNSRQTYMIDVPKFKQYQELAQELALRMHAVLRAAKPNDIQEMLLQAAGPKPEGFTTHDVGVYPADESDESELSGLVVPETRTIPESGMGAPVASDLPPPPPGTPPADDPPADDPPPAPLFPLMAAVSGADLAGVLGIDPVARHTKKTKPAGSAPPGTVAVQVKVPVFKK